MDIINLLRPKHYIKNFFIFLPLVFANKIFDINSVLPTVTAFLSFCFAASYIYIINDIADLKHDLHHPKKKLRPLASGKVTVFQAKLVSTVCFLLSIFFAYRVNYKSLAIVLIYIAMNLLYSFILKHQTIVDVMVIAIGFILRITIGAVSIGSDLSNWILLCTFFLSLFLGFAKRRSELILLSDDDTATSHRPVLDGYDVSMLNMFIGISVCATIISYSLYTIDETVTSRFSGGRMFYTVIFVVYGLFRYLQLIYTKNEGGDPAELVTSDRAIFINILLWGITVLFLITKNDLLKFIWR